LFAFLAEGEKPGDMAFASVGRGIDSVKRNRVAAFVLTIQKRFGEDGGGNLAASLTYFAFLSIFPLLLVAASVIGFVLADDPLTKMMGLGLATAIAVDATIVRLVLVPATMKLLGRSNWWLPGWLDRLLPGRTDGSHVQVAVVAGLDMEKEPSGRRAPG